MNKKKKQILEAAKMLFIERGFTNTSITDVIELAQVSKGTFYNHFSSKNSCLIAIIHDIHETTIIERQKISTPENLMHLETLIKELTIFYQIVMMSNLYEIMIQNLAFKEDSEIMTEIKVQSTIELKWLAQRLIDIFGNRITEIAYDCASLIIGTIQHTCFLSRMHNACNSIEIIIEETLKKIEPIVYSINLNRTVLLTSSLFENSDTPSSIHVSKSKELAKKLEKFYEDQGENFTLKNTEYTLFLIELLNDNPDKKYIIQSVANSFVQSFEEEGKNKIEAHKIFKLMMNEIIL